MELCIGTAQFGMPYGIAAKEHPSQKSAHKILEYAFENGIYAIDTASAYGNAEKIAGSFLSQVKRNTIQVITKIKPDALAGIPAAEYYVTLKNNLLISLHNLQTDYVDGCLFHNAEYIENEEALYALYRLQQDNLTVKTGLSVYLPSECKKALLSPYVSLLQVPYNLLDQRLNNVLPQNTACEIHARSAFLQGLLLMDEKDIPPHLSEAKQYIHKIQSFCEKHSISRTGLLLAFVQTQKKIDKIVFGTDNITQLKQIIHDFKINLDNYALTEFARGFIQVQEHIFMPNLWN